MRVLTIIPTYNELESLPKTLGRLRTAVPASDVLVVDDNSPDGTGQLADRIAAEDARSTSCTGRARQGWARPTSPASSGAWTPATTSWWRWTPTARTSRSSCPSCWTPCEQGADLAMGSRWVPGGSVVNWPLYRQAISRVGSTYARDHAGRQDQGRHGRLPRLPPHTLEKLNLDSVDSVGYGFQVDLAWRVAKLGLTIVERPITFVERELGASKMSGEHRGRSHDQRHQVGPDGPLEQADAASSAPS